VTSPFDSSTPLLFQWSVDIFVYLFPFKSYSTISLRLEIPIKAEISGGCGISRPINACVHQRDLEKAPPCVKPRRLSHHAYLCDVSFGRYAIARKTLEKNYQKKKSHKVVIFHVCGGGAHIQPIAMEVCTSVQVTNVINRVNFCGCSVRGLVCA
jgi:hypothetical protein